VENISLVQDLVRWVAQKTRTYDDVLDAWRTSCPRLTIWEDAVDAGLVGVSYDNAANRVVSITDQGRQFLADARTSPHVGKPVPPGELSGQKTD
jgi:hypothetical protein